MSETKPPKTIFSLDKVSSLFSNPPPSSLRTGNNVDYDDSLLSKKVLTDIEDIEIPLDVACKLMNGIIGGKIGDKMENWLATIVLNNAFFFSTVPGSSKRVFSFEPGRKVTVGEEESIYPFFEPAPKSNKYGALLVALGRGSYDDKGKFSLNQKAVTPAPDSVLKPVTDLMQDEGYFKLTDYDLPENSLSTTCRLGAYCQNMIRLMVKNPTNVKKNLTEPEGNDTQPRFVHSFNTLYPGFTIHPLNGAQDCPSEDTLRRLLVGMRSLGSVGYAYLIRMTYASKTSHDDMLLAFIRGFGGIVVEEYGVPLFSWLKKAARISRKNEFQLCSQLLGAGSLSDSCTNLLKFMMRHYCSDDQYKSLSDVFGEVPRSKDYFWSVARIIDHDYNASVGKRGNEDMIYLLLLIYNFYEVKTNIFDGKLVIDEPPMGREFLKKKSVRIIAYFNKMEHTVAIQPDSEQIKEDDPFYQEVHAKQMSLKKYQEAAESNLRTVVNTGSSLYKAGPVDDKGAVSEEED